jgi:large subunit ribosomal protein L19
MYLNLLYLHMDSKMLQKIEEKYYKKHPKVGVGDTVELHLKIQEGSKQRIQLFKGIILSIKGSGLSTNIVVRKISSGIGVEKIIPLHSPTLEKVKIIKKGDVRRAKLYYMRERVGKKAMKIKMGAMEEEKEEVEKVEKEEVKE